MGIELGGGGFGPIVELNLEPAKIELLKPTDVSSTPETPSRSSAPRPFSNFVKKIVAAAKSKLG